MLYRIFVVEDHPVMREAYEQVIDLEPTLTSCGSAESAEEAMLLLGDAPCDLLLTDFRLPGLSGVDLIRQIQTSRPDLPSIVISAHDEAGFARQATEAGAAAFLSKQNLIATLVPTILNVLGHGAA